MILGVLAGKSRAGGSDNSNGYFIEPTVVVSKDPKSKLMAEEIFGPVLTIYVYPENEYDQTLHVCDQTSPYALTGSIFALDRGAIVKAMDVLRHAAGNFYVNDKPTGSPLAPPVVVYSPVLWAGVQT